MKLIINADDFGYTKGVSEGIIEGYHKGIIKSTTALCNMPGLSYAAELAKQAPNLGIGVHLTLTLGDSLTGGDSITTDGVKFKGRKQFYEELDQVDAEEVYAEFKAQIERFIEVFHRMPDHLDSHHSVHDAGHLLSVTKRLSEEYALPVRRYASFTYVPGFYADTATVDALLALLEAHKEEAEIEVMTHPGFCDLELYQESSYHTHRVVELAVLCHPTVLEYIKEQGILVTNYTMR